MLDQNEKEHSATVEATQELVNGKKVLGPAGGPPTQNLTIQKPVDFTPISDLEKAKLAEAEGKHVELNDDNQIVDKRELLSAGLNLSAPNTRRLGLGSSKEKEKEADVRAHTAVGSAASVREINERRRREIERQMVEEKERTKEEHDRRERERVQRTVAKRNTEEDVKSARERYLERKRRRLEEPAENPEGGSANGGGGGT